MLRTIYREKNIDRVIHDGPRTISADDTMLHLHPHHFHRSFGRTGHNIFLISSRGSRMGNAPFFGGYPTTHTHPGDENPKTCISCKNRAGGICRWDVFLRGGGLPAGGRTFGYLFGTVFCLRKSQDAFFLPVSRKFPVTRTCLGITHNNIPFFNPGLP